MRFLLAIMLAACLFAVEARDVGAAVAPDPVKELATDGYVLSAAYPNPFNPATQFSLTVAERQTVSVEVFNTLGQRVQMIYSGLMDAGESRTFVFDAGNLPSGIYLYRVTGRTFTETRNVTLMK
jgi:hypothetical protein